MVLEEDVAYIKSNPAICCDNGLINFVLCDLLSKLPLKVIIIFNHIQHFV